jgi:hypothetical protein
MEVPAQDVIAVAAGILLLIGLLAATAFAR